MTQAITVGLRSTSAASITGTSLAVPLPTGTGEGDALVAAQLEPAGQSETNERRNYALLDL